MKRQRKSFSFRMMERKSCPHPKLEEFLTLAAGPFLPNFPGDIFQKPELLENMENEVIR